MRMKRAFERRASAGGPGSDAKRGTPERRKNRAHFPVPRANHQRIVCSLAAGVSSAARVPRKQKAGARPAFFRERVRSSVLRDDRAAPAIVHADGDEVGILPDALLREESAGWQE